MVTHGGSANGSTAASSGRRSNGQAPATTAVKRVAVYTRQSVADELEFNSIEAQRESVENYVLSQRGERWQTLPDRYDDAGISGATTTRPAFQRLIAAVQAGGIDVVAVYKLDRLSRSLLDFAQIMALFERHGVSFVAVTQQFSTATSVGKLTLNLLMSFAEFERETISERTRDKMIATRRKGMWTGGSPALGFDVRDKQLSINAEEAEQVRQVFATYLAVGSLGATLVELERLGIHGKTWTTKAGTTHRGLPFRKSTLSKLLTNVLYIGRARCGDDVVEGRHDAIVDRATFEAVQRLLREHRRDPGQTKNKWGALLRGIVTCARCGAGMSHTFTRKGGRCYRFYVCARAMERAAACPGSRAAAGDLEGFVVQRIAEIGRDPEILKLTMARAREQLAARAPELEAESLRLAQESGRLGAERGNLIAAVGEGGGARSSILARLAEVDERLTAITVRRDTLAKELAGIEGAAIDEDDLRTALAEFEPVWHELFTAERVRIMRLLIEEVRFDGDRSEVAITFRGNGVRTLATEARRKP